MVADLNIFTFASNRVVLDMSFHDCGNIVQGIKFLVVLHEEIGVNFVDKYLKSDVWVNLVGYFDNFKQFIAASIFILLMCIYNVNERSTLPKCLNITWIIFSKFFSTRKILNLELNIGIVINIYTKENRLNCAKDKHLLVVSTC